MQADTDYDTYESSGAGWKTFAGIMIIIVGTFNVIDGLRAITSSNQIENNFANGRSSSRSRTTSRPGAGSS